MDKGKIIEYDHASRLLSNKQSFFYSIVKALGDETARQLAEKAFETVDLESKEEISQI